MINVTRPAARGSGLSEAQLARLEALERARSVTQFEAGEAQFYGMQGTPEQRSRALAVVGRAK
jgi:hypothetical protein